MSFYARKPSQGDIHVHHRQRPAGRSARLMTAEQARRLNTPMSEQQQMAFNAAMADVARPSGGYSGCGYVDYDQGIVCQNANMPNYHPNAESFFSNWVANVDYPYGPDFPQPNVMADGTLEQIMAGGGGGMNPCIDDCSCANDPQCTCRNADPAMQCGWPSVGNDCMEPVPNGKYASLAACEFANSLGYYDPSMQARR